MDCIAVQVLSRSKPTRR